MSNVVDRFTGLHSTLGIKAPARVATTANITLSGFQTIDGVTLAATDDNLCVLVKDQTTLTDNGLWIAASGAWTRRADFDGNTDIVKGTQVYVAGGTVGSGEYVVTTADPIVIGTSNIVIVPFPVQPLDADLTELAGLRSVAVIHAFNFQNYR